MIDAGNADGRTEKRTEGRTTAGGATAAPLKERTRTPAQLSSAQSVIPSIPPSFHHLSFRFSFVTCVRVGVEQAKKVPVRPSGPEPGGRDILY